MTLIKRFLVPCPALLLAGSLALTLVVPVRAQQHIRARPQLPVVVESDDAFPFEIGHAAKTGSVCTVTATQPTTSKLTGQKLRFKIVGTTGTNTVTSYYTVATGKYKTVAQLDKILSEIFARFLSNPVPAAPGQEIGKIGDTQHGGEVHFFTDPSNRLRLESLHPGEQAHVSYYDRADVEMLQSALTGQPSA